MGSSHALGILVEQSVKRVEQASIELGQANNQLHELQRQKQQIIENLHLPMQPVLSGSQFQNQLAWRQRLYELEASCDRAIEQASGQVTECQAGLVDAHTEKLKFETVLNRKLVREQKIEAKKEQKATDEFAANAWRRQQSA